MKKDKLPFQIGKHYENWEFDLEPSDMERILGFDSYFYIRELSFLDIIPRYTELVFCWDILKVVILTIDFETLVQLHQFRDILDLNFGNRAKFKNEDLQAEIYSVARHIELWLVYIPDGYRIEISYGSSKYLEEIYN
jgi:hypothetical protein